MTKNSLKSIFIFTRLLLDAGAFLIALHAAYWVRFQWPWFLQYVPAFKGVPPLAVYQESLVALLPFFLVVFYYLGMYRTTMNSSHDELIQTIRSVLLCALLTTAMTFVYRGMEYSRLVIGFWTAGSIVFIYVLHEIHKALFRRLTLKMSGPHKVLVIGRGKALTAIKEMSPYEPFFRTQFLEHVPSVDDLQQRLSDESISEVVLIQGSVSASHILEISRLCESHNIDCQVVPDLLEIRRGEIIFNGFCGLPTFRIRPLSLHGSNYVLKRGFDILASACILAILGIPLLIVALLIKIDSAGPVLYTQDRMGWRSRTFKLFKFRTMVVDADARLEKIKHLSDRSGPVFKMKNDPRITRVGRWLRKFSIDELPQILNVLKGDMSLVGPRPQVLWEAAAYDDHAKKRLRVMPGITGLWQVSGRAALSYEEMINLDIYYLENWSLGLDLKILLRTLPAIFAKEGAY